MSERDKVIQEFLDLKEGDARSLRLQVMNAPQRKAFLEAWAESDLLRLSDMIALPRDLRWEALQYVTGNNARGISGVAGKTFIVGPDKPGVAVDLEVGMRGTTERRYLRIDRPLALPASQAMNALCLAGEKGEDEAQRGKLREWTQDEFAAYRPPKKPPQPSDVRA